MTVVHNVEICLTLVYYHVTITTSKGDKVFRVRDDGWALFVQDSDGKPYARIGTATDSDRKPGDKESALAMLTVWAKERFEN